MYNLKKSTESVLTHANTCSRFFSVAARTVAGARFAEPSFSPLAPAPRAPKAPPPVAEWGMVSQAQRKWPTGWVTPPDWPISPASALHMVVIAALGNRAPTSAPRDTLVIPPPAVHRPTQPRSQPTWRTLGQEHSVSVSYSVHAPRGRSGKHSRFTQPTVKQIST